MMVEDDFVELKVASNRLANVLYAFISVLVVAYFAFIGVIVWQIGDNTHDLLVTVNETVDTLP